MNSVHRLMPALRDGDAEIIDLMQTLSPDTPALPLPPEVGQCAAFCRREVSRYDARGVASYWNEFSMNEHTGMHFDAPIHRVTSNDLANHPTETVPLDDPIAQPVVLHFSKEAAGAPNLLLTCSAIEPWGDQAWLRA